MNPTPTQPLASRHLPVHRMGRPLGAGHVLFRVGVQWGSAGTLLVHAPGTLVGVPRPRAHPVRRHRREGRGKVDEVGDPLKE